MITLALALEVPKAPSVVGLPYGIYGRVGPSQRVSIVPASCERQELDVAPGVAVP